MANIFQQQQPGSVSYQIGQWLGFVPREPFQPTRPVVQPGGPYVATPDPVRRTGGNGPLFSNATRNAIQGLLDRIGPRGLATVLASLEQRRAGGDPKAFLGAIQPVIQPVIGQGKAELARQQALRDSAKPVYQGNPFAAGLVQGANRQPVRPL